MESRKSELTTMDIAAEEAVAGTAAQGDLAEVVARAGAMAMAAAPSHHRRPPSPSPSPAAAAADHNHIVSSAARAAGHIMVVPAACYDEEPRPRSAAAACGEAVMSLDVPSSMVVDPYQLSSSAAMATPHPHGHGGYWLPAAQISPHACYGLDVAMGGAAADADGGEPMMMRISPVTTPPAAHHQIMKRLINSSLEPMQSALSHSSIILCGVNFFGSIMNCCLLPSSIDASFEL